MSGHKRATIKLGQIDAQRMEQLSNRLRQVEEDFQEISSKVSQERKDQLARYNEQLTDRQIEYSRILSNYHSQLGEFEQHTNQTLFDQAQNIQVQIKNNNQSILDYTQAWIDHNMQSMISILEENKDIQNNYFSDIHLKLNQIQISENQKFNLAQDGIQGAFGILQSIDQIYDHERYFPGLFDQLTLDYEMALHNLAAGMAEAALLGAQQVQQQGNRLRINIETQLQQNARIKTFALERIKQIETLVIQNKSVQAIDLNGNPIDYFLDVDFWSGGQLNTLFDRVEGLLVQLETNMYDLDYEDIDRIVQNILPQMEQSLGDIIARARLNVIMSQVRFNIAEFVVDALSEQGFSPQNAKYLDQDERKPYQVVTNNYDGSEVKVYITSGNQPGSYNLEVDSVEAVPITNSELFQRTNLILESLRSKGLRVSPPLELKPGQNLVQKENHSKPNQYDLPLQSTYVN
jgi:hypothetical protein